MSNFNKTEVVNSIKNGFLNSRLSVRDEIYYEEPGWSETIELYSFISEKFQINPNTAFVGALFRHFRRLSDKPDKEEIICITDEMEFEEIQPKEFHKIFEETTGGRIPKALDNISLIDKAWRIFDDPLCKWVFAKTENGFVLFAWESTA